MKSTCTPFWAVISLLASPVAAQVFTIPPGAYRTAEAYYRRQPQPAGTDAFYPDKRGQLVVVVPQGPRTTKLRVTPDSVWGYVSGKGRTFRFYRGQEYKLDFVDTLCVYSSTAVQGLSGQMSTATNAPAPQGRQQLPTARYYFSRGLKGLVFPLTARYLREMYEASNPAFVEALSKLRFDQSLSDFDRKTGLFRVTTVYRQAAAR